MKKTRIRKSIRVGGRLISRVFYSKEAAERWYIDQRHKKIFAESGTPLQLDQTITLNAYFDFEWFPARKRDVGKSTWAGDLQRFNDYFRRSVGKFPIAQITANQLRAALITMTQDHGLSIKTRNSGRALLSSIFKAAFTREEPLVKTNPVPFISFPRVRAGDQKKHEPKSLNSDAQVKKFLDAAAELGPDFEAWAMISIKTGMRSGEVCALRWGAVDFEAGVVHVRERYLNAERRVEQGTKAGRFATRIVPLSGALRALLTRRRAAQHPEGDEFILQRAGGENWDENMVRKTCLAINEASGLHVTPHGLRHSFARSFAARHGNMEVLQQILGHATAAMTQHYSKLQLEHLQAYIDDEDEKPAKTRLKIVENE